MERANEAINQELEKLQEKILELTSEIDRIKDERSQEILENRKGFEDCYLVDAPALPSQESPNDALPPSRPFDVNWDFEANAWDIFLPDGCVMAEGVVAEYDGERTTNGLATLPTGEKFFGHVYKYQNTTWKFSIDANATKSGAKYNFPIVQFDSDLVEVAGLFVNNIISFGGGTAETVVGGGCYALTKQGSVVSFANCYYMAGDVIYSGPGGAATAFASQFVALKINANNPSNAILEGYSDLSALTSASLNVNYVTIPLYHFDENCGVVTDFRNIPRAQMVEVFSS